jgi:hypothetical protein
LEKLDKLRGSVPREIFLEKLLSQFNTGTDENEEDFSEIEDRPISSGSESSADKTDAIDKTTNKNLEMLLSKMDKIDELNDRIKELESRQFDLESSAKDSEDSAVREHKDHIKTDSGKSVKMFEFANETIDDNNDIGIDPDSEELSGSYEFVFACSKCNKVVEEMDVICPFCGSELEDVPSSIEWLEKMGDRHGQLLPDDDWDDDYYEEGLDNSEEDYDPSDGRHTESYDEYNRYQGTKGMSFTGFEGPDSKNPFCHICGEETEFITRYGQWYCYSCNEYTRSPGSSTEVEKEKLRKNRSKVLERVINRRHAELDKGDINGDKPLRYYGPYASSDAVTKISLVDSDQPDAKRKRK